MTFGATAKVLLLTCLLLFFLLVIRTAILQFDQIIKRDYQETCHSGGNRRRKTLGLGDGKRYKTQV